MTDVNKIREWVDLAREGDDHAIDNLDQAYLDLVDYLLDVAEAAKVEIDARHLNTKNSFLAEAIEELELVEWIIIPPKKRLV